MLKDTLKKGIAQLPDVRNKDGSRVDGAPESQPHEARCSVATGSVVGRDGTDHSHEDSCFNDPPDDWICTGCEEHAEPWERPHADGESECGYCGNREWRRPECTSQNVSDQPPARG